MYLGDASTGSMLGIRPADGGTHRYYEVGIEHLAFEVDERDEVDQAYRRCLSAGANIHFPARRGSRRRGVLRILRV